MDRITRRICPLLCLPLLLLACLYNTASATPFDDDGSLWAISPEPAWGSQAELVEPASDDIGGRYYNIFEKHKRFDHTAEDSSTYYRYVYTINNETGLDQSAPITVEFDPVYESVRIHKAVIHRNNNTIDQLTAENIQLLQRETQLENGLYDGNQTLHLLLSDQRVGDRVEYSFTVVGHNPVFDGHVFGWARLQSSVSIGNYYFQLSYPQDKKIQTRVFAGDIKSTKSTANGYEQLTWENKHTEPASYQSNVPSSHFEQTYVQYSEFNNWTEVAEWAAPLYMIAPEASEPVIAKAAEIAANSKDLNEKIERSIQFVQDQVRYTGINTGIGGFKPDSPADILQRRYGDCKDKAVLLVALLNEFGVTAYPALVHSNDGESIPNYLPSPDAFNHMIVKLADDHGNIYWIDGTITLQGSRLTTLSQGDYDNALVPAEAAKGLQSYQVTQLATPEKEVLEQYDLHYNFDENVSTLVITTVNRGSTAEYMRRTLQKSGRRKLQTDYLNYYQNRFDTIEVDVPMQVTDDRDANVLTLLERYTIDDAWYESEELATDTTTSYILDLHADTITAQLSLPDDQRRVQPLTQYHPVNVKHNIELKTADGWNIPSSSTTIDNDHFYYRSSEVVKGKTLFLSYQLNTKTNLVSVAESRRYIKDLKRLLDNPYYQVSVEFDNVNTRGQELVNQLESIGSWFKQTADALSGKKPAVVATSDGE